MNINRIARDAASGSRLALARCLRDETGGTLVEHAFLLCLLTFLLIGSLKLLGSALANAGHADEKMLGKVRPFTDRPL